LNHIATIDEEIGTVAIGGITLDNVQSVVYRSWAAKKGLQGVAVVSAIMGATEPKTVAEEFTKKIFAYPPFATHLTEPRASEIHDLLTAIPSVVAKVAAVRPLTHSMINYVVANFAANALLAV
jgi:thiamine-phosphate diphosphorylase/hydroxyethylthiazole kinase